MADVVWWGLVAGVLIGGMLLSARDGPLGVPAPLGIGAGLFVTLAAAKAITAAVDAVAGSLGFAAPQEEWFWWPFGAIVVAGALSAASAHAHRPLHAWERGAWATFMAAMLLGGLALFGALAGFGFFMLLAVAEYVLSADLHATQVLNAIQGPQIVVLGAPVLLALVALQRKHRWAGAQGEPPYGDEGVDHWSDAGTDSGC